jgi:uncharacterized membrane protein YcaP (DUF421 family)
MELDQIFGLSMNPLELVLRGTLFYFGLVLLFRFLLRRDLGELGVADVLFVALLADAAQNGMAGEYRTVTDGAILLATLGGWNAALNYATYRWRAARRLFEAPTVELVRDGRILRRNLRREWMTVEELMGKLREEGIGDVSEVKLAVLEADGELSVLRGGGEEQPTDPRGRKAGGKHVE